MTHETVLPIGSVYGRQLLAEHVAADGADGNRQLLDQVMATVQGLDLQPGQLERIHEAFVHAVTRATAGGELAAAHRLRVRIWLLGCCVPNRGWGFFVVEKGQEPPGADMVTDHLVELFLYQESGP